MLVRLKSRVIKNHWMKPLPHRSVGVTGSHDFLNRIDGIGDERLEILDVNTRVGPLFQFQLFADVFT